PRRPRSPSRRGRRACRPSPGRSDPGVVRPAGYDRRAGAPMTASRWLLSLLFVPLAAFSQVAPTRTWPELSEAVQDRVNRNAYPQLPPGARPAPVVMSVGALDSYKEYVVEQYGPGYLAAGLGYLAIDMPGTGEAPIKIDVGAERLFSRLLDALVARQDIDAKR